MLTTSVAGRTWHYSHALGRETAEHNGKTGGFAHPVDLAVSTDGTILVLSRGYGFDPADFGKDIFRRVGKTTIDEEHIGDFARAEFTWPVGLDLSKDGNVYVSDEYENLIIILPPNDVYPFPDHKEGGERIGAWGELGMGEGQFVGPAGIAFDAEDNLFVVDKGNNRVQKYTKDGKFLLGWGRGGDSPGDFDEPWGITVDQDGDVYVADWGNSRVQKFSADGDYLMSFGSNGGDGGDLDHPASVVVDSDGDVYVTDWGNGRVQIYEANGDIITALYGDVHELSKAGHHILNRDPQGILTFNAIDHALSHTVRFERPVGIAVYPGDRIVVTDTRGRLLVYDKDNDYVPPSV